jgi:hypothetical protein
VSYMLSVANKPIMPSVVTLYVFLPSVVAPSSCTCWWVVKADDPCYVSRSTAVVLKVLALVQVRFTALTVVPVLRQFARDGAKEAVGLELLDAVIAELPANHICLEPML